MQILGFNEVVRRAHVPAAVVAAAALVLVGCGGGASPSASPRATGSTSASPSAAAGPVLNLVATEYSFTPSKLKASAGRTTIRVTNRGAMEHDFVVALLHVHITVQPGKSAEATVALTPGHYTSICSVPGHKESGMHGTLTVS